MTDIQLAYKDAYACMKIIKDFCNNQYSGVSGSPIEDPWASATGKTRTLFAQMEDEILGVARFPKLSIGLINRERGRLTQGKPQDYRERHRYDISIMYTCEKRHKWTKNTIAYLGTHQCVRYLEYLGDQLKKYSGSFEEFNELVIGDISNIVPDPKTNTYSAFLPIKVDSYGRVGD